MFQGVGMDWHFLGNVAAAFVLGTVIGLERQWRQHQAGLRTNALVALGAALFVSLSRLMGDENSPTRIASYIVSGLGFLGGGVILREGLNVRGMNTAATLWCTGAVGTLAGAGFPLEAAVGTAAVIAVNLGLRVVVRWIDAQMKMTTDVETYYRLRVACAAGDGSGFEESHIRAILLRHVGSRPRMSIQGITTEEVEKEGKVIVADIYALERNDRALEEIVARLSIEPEVTGVSWRRETG
jgi:putative Mg2+ transporter-C (MgtC) family protein